jgi:hypothetical protein
LTLVSIGCQNCLIALDIHEEVHIEQPPRFVAQRGELG